MEKILHVVSCLEMGGTEAFIMNNYRKLDHSKYQFDFAVFIEKDYAYIAEIKRLGGRVFFIGLPSIKGIDKFKSNLTNVIKKQGPYTAIHCHVNIQNGFALEVAKACGIPIRISHSHDTSGKGTGINIKTIYKEYLIKKNATHIMACSYAAGEYLYGKKYFLKYGKVISNGIDIEPFIAKDDKYVLKLKNEFYIPAECKFIIGNITRFEPKKNPLFIIQVFREIVKIEPTAILLLGGPDGGQLSEVKKKVKEMGLEKNLRFIGVRHDVVTCLKLIDIYLFPSLYEGLPIALLEAQASGCLCIASTSVSEESDMGLGTIWYLDLNESSYIWAKKILTLYADYKKPKENDIREAFSKNGYDINSSYKQLIEVYNGK